MTTAVKDADEQVWRWERVLTGPDAIDDDLAFIGTWLRPPKGPFARPSGEKEDYVLRRLLVAWKQSGALALPVTVRAEAGRPGRPDFVLAWEDGRELGIAVTEAGKENYLAWLTLMAEQTDATAPKAFLAIRQSIVSEAKSFDKGFYHSPKACDLVVRDNTGCGGLGDKAEIYRRLAQSIEEHSRFRQTHVVFGEAVWLDIFGEAACVDVSRAYEIDYAGWIWDQTALMRKAASDALDLPHIAEELEDLAKREKRSLRSHLRNLMHHLLKWQFQPQLRGQSWRLTIESAREEISELLTEMPSLRTELNSEVAKQYGKARRAAAIESDIPISEFPEACPYRLEQLLEPEYLPDETSEAEER